MRLAIFLVITAFFACNEATKQPAAAQSESGPLQAPYAAEFYDSLQLTMDAYYDLTEGLSQGNITYTDKWAAILKQHIDSLPLKTLQMDSSKLDAIGAATGSISAELTGVLGEKEL